MKKNNISSAQEQNESAVQVIYPEKQALPFHGRLMNLLGVVVLVGSSLAGAGFLAVTALDKFGDYRRELAASAAIDELKKAVEFCQPRFPQCNYPKITDEADSDTPGKLESLLRGE